MFTATCTSYKVNVKTINQDIKIRSIKMCCYGKGVNKSAIICKSKGHKRSEGFKQLNTAQRTERCPWLKYGYHYIK